MLEPATSDIARAVVSGDLSYLHAATGWPHDDTVDAMSMAMQQDAGPAWLVTLDGLIIGDCGTLGKPNRLGEVEIGYGLAVSSRGRGYATEAARAMCRWLFTQPDVSLIRAVGVLADNLASRRVLEKVGFSLTLQTDQHASYALASDQLT